MKHTEWTEDNEALGIAVKLKEKYPTIFGTVDLDKINVVRDQTSKSKKSGELKACGFPYSINSAFAYYLVINNFAWKTLSEAQQVAEILHFLCGVMDGGTDEASENYAKVRNYDVKDFIVVLAAVGGNFMWKEPGMEVINPLSDEATESVLQALEKLKADEQ